MTGVKRSLTFLGLALATSSQAQPPPGYYDPAAGFTGDALKQALHDIIDDHTVLQYSALWAAFENTDQRSDGYVWDIYSDAPGGTPPYVYSFVVDQCGTYSGEGDCFNREHSFPSTWFDDLPPMNSDLFHIYPTDGYVNQKRGSLPYGEVGSADWTSQNGTRTGLCVSPGYSGTVCEPIDEYKGDLARSYFYMLTRYAPEASAWSADMLSAGDLSPWAEALLLQWHTADPVSTKEVDRNNAIYALQDNRNPYIDHPEWVGYIWGPGASVHEDANNAPRIWINDDRLNMSGFNGPCTVEVFDAVGRVLFAISTDEDVVSLSAGSTGVAFVAVRDRSTRLMVPLLN